MKPSKGGLFTYTTSIEPQSTINEIQQILSAHGAKSIMTNYTDNGKIESLSFAIEVDGKPRGIRLPCDPVPVFKVLERQAREGKIPRRLVDEHQALRVAWRIVHYWIKAQMAILETQMVKMEQIFLPYMIMRDGKTLFESMVKTGFKLLGSKIETTIKNTAEEGEVMQLKEADDET
ncbi:MAG TPA: hypothetical protein VNX68_16240 [Nitrosopumilaceae archaeon]|jgi:hypothetical protein|nr:hypothetical protein [Nitrosopumilaceae archaeon]